MTAARAARPIGVTSQVYASVAVALLGLAALVGLDRAAAAATVGFALVAFAQSTVRAALSMADRSAAVLDLLMAGGMVGMLATGMGRAWLLLFGPLAVAAALGWWHHPLPGPTRTRRLHSLLGSLAMIVLVFAAGRGRGAANMAGMSGMIGWSSVSAVPLALAALFAGISFAAVFQAMGTSGAAPSRLHRLTLTQGAACWCNAAMCASAATMCLAMA